MRIKRISIGQLNQKPHFQYIQPYYYPGKRVILQIKASLCILVMPLNAPSYIVSKFSVVPEIQANQCVFSLHAPIYTLFVHSWTPQDISKMYVHHLYIIIYPLHVFPTTQTRHLYPLQPDVQLTDICVHTFFNLVLLFQCSWCRCIHPFGKVLKPHVMDI